MMMMMIVSYCTVQYIDVLLYGVDIDECNMTSADSCHTCHNTPGSYFCTCNEGYAPVKNIYCKGI